MRRHLRALRVESLYANALQVDRPVASKRSLVCVTAEGNWRWLPRGCVGVALTGAILTGATQ